MCCLYCTLYIKKKKKNNAQTELRLVPCVIQTIFIWGCGCRRGCTGYLCLEEWPPWSCCGPDTNQTFTRLRKVGAKKGATRTGKRRKAKSLPPNNIQMIAINSSSFFTACPHGGHGWVGTYPSVSLHWSPARPPWPKWSDKCFLFFYQTLCEVGDILKSDLYWSWFTFCRSL